jgi:hypothetical protein
MANSLQKPATTPADKLAHAAWDEPTRKAASRGAVTRVVQQESTLMYFVQSEHFRWQSRRETSGRKALHRKCRYDHYRGGRPGGGWKGLRTRPAPNPPAPSGEVLAVIRVSGLPAKVFGIPGNPGAGCCGVEMRHARLLRTAWGRLRPPESHGLTVACRFGARPAARSYEK